MGAKSRLKKDDLTSRGISISRKELQKMCMRACDNLLELMPQTQFQENSRNDFTVDEAGILERVGFELEMRKNMGTEDPIAKGISEYTAILCSSLTVEQAANMLGVEDSRIRQRLTGKPPTLFGIKLNSQWHIPAFQFEGNRIVPNIDKVISMLSPELHPLTVYRWLTNPNPDLIKDEGSDDETVLSPLNWLRLGLDAGIVIDMAADL
jgi:plasmid maintenance system killer protein